MRLTRIVEPQHWDNQALFKDFFGQTRTFPPTDIDVVNGIHREADELAFMKSRRGDEDIRRLTITEPRVVADKDIARLHRLRRKGLN